MRDRVTGGNKRTPPFLVFSMKRNYMALNSENQKNEESSVQLGETK